MIRIEQASSDGECRRTVATCNGHEDEKMLVAVVNISEAEDNMNP